MIPSVFEISTSIGCNIGCRYCAQDLLVRKYAKRSAQRFLSLESFKAAIEKIPIDVEIRFGGFAEPWLNKNCSDMALYADSRGHKISIFTTLVGMCFEDVGKMAKIQKLNFISVHLPSQDQYENIRVNDEYQMVLKNIDQSKLPLSYHYHGTNLHPTVRNALSVRRRIVAEEISSKCDHVRIEGVSKHLVPKRGKLVCSLGMRCNIMLPNGDVVLCCMDYGLQYILGNIFQSDYETLLNSETFVDAANKLRSKDSNIICRKCEFAKYANPFLYMIRQRMPSAVKSRIKNLISIFDMRAFAHMS
jgi:radical SAM protein with 4Fe4S-binding SPASM domain